MKTDALGNEVILGETYGVSVDSNGVTTITIGVAVKETKTGITLEVIQRRSGLYHDAPTIDNTYIKNKMTAKALKLFPVALDSMKTD